MSLHLSFIAKDEKYKEIEKELDKEISDHCNDFFGTDNWRKEVWGHDVMEEIGCTTLHKLRTLDLMVFDEGLLQLKKELNIVLERIDYITGIIHRDAELIEFRVKNALEVIRVAEKNIDKVGIWIL